MVDKEKIINFSKWCLSWLSDQVIRTTNTFADRQPEQLPTINAVETALVTVFALAVVLAAYLQKWLSF